VILTDDQRWDTLDAMPSVQSELVQHGATFANAFVSNSLCCPSRASILTGLYSHSTGVWRNQPPFGGWSSFDDTSTIATRLQAAGYKTGLFGKYFNGYEDAALAGYVPPGWDRWVAFPRATFYDYGLSLDGALQTYGNSPADYSTDVLAAETTSFIRSTTGPMFAYFAPYAPHNPATPGPTHQNDFSGLAPWRPPSYDEKNMSDKPGWAQTLKPWNASKRAHKDAFRIDQYRSLQSVDEAVGQIVQALADTGRLSNTMIVFMSDNGLSWGEHRWGTKRVAYEEAIRIPMVIRYDPTTTVARIEDRIALNIDLAPTIFELAGITGATVDGQSLLPLLSNASASWRHDFLLEHLEKANDRVPTYCGVRTERYTYVYYRTARWSCTT
jgi:arylsulfatase A-like enzyme